MASDASVTRFLTLGVSSSYFSARPSVVAPQSASKIPAFSGDG